MSQAKKSIEKINSLADDRSVKVECDGNDTQDVIVTKLEEEQGATQTQKGSHPQHMEVENVETKENSVEKMDLASKIDIQLSSLEGVMNSGILTLNLLKSIKTLLQTHQGNNAEDSKHSFAKVDCSNILCSITQNISVAESSFHNTSQDIRRFLDLLAQHLKN